MSNWTEAELEKIATADDLHISPFREDGVTYGTPTWIWSVVVDGALYVRAYNGKNSRWYKAAMAQKAGRVRVSGIKNDVVFEPVEGAINQAIDAAYRAKYASSRYLAQMIGDRARAATVKIKLAQNATKGANYMAADNVFRSSITPADVQAVSPALANYTKTAVVDGVWNRPELSRRDRSILTVATLIARIQTIGMEHYFAIALDSGVTPAELSEIVTHLAFYCGWSNAFQAVEVLQGIFAARGIGADQLPEISPELLPLDEEAEEKRAAQVQANFGETSQGVVENTTKFLFRDLWLRPALAPRDRSLITVAALVAAGQVAQIPYHLNRAMDNGLTRDEASEVLTHMAFYSGWPTVFSALPVFKDVFAGRKS